MLFSDSAQKKKIEFMLSIDPVASMNYEGDPVRVRQILSNLLGNAIKFTEKGEIVVTVYTRAVNSYRHMINIEVSDTGIGLDKNKFNSIFHAFSQEDNSTTRKYGGTGLGLAICKKLIQMMGGQITLDSSPGVGTVFKVQIPLTHRTDVTINNKLSFDELNNKKVLIVDDNNTNLEILNNQLTNIGMECTTTNNALQALQLMQNSVDTYDHFDLAILDMHMPEHNGLELAGMIHAEEKFSATKLIIMSSVSTQIKDKKGSGISACLTKPVPQNLLIKTLQNTLSTDSEFPITEEIDIARYISLNTGSGEGMKVLIAEDNNINSQVAMAMLDQLKFKSTVVENGEQAVEAFTNNSYDVVLMDMQMPRMDGLKATRLIRAWEKDKSLPETPIIALTANATTGDRDRCINAGMNDYLSKPFSLLDISNKLQQYLVKAETSKTQQSRVHPVKQPKNPIIDKIMHDRIRSLQQPGQPDLLQQIIKMYLDSTPDSIIKIKTAIKNRDSESLRMTAHSLKSSSANLGASELANLLKKIEALGKKEAIDAAAMEIPLLEKHYQNAIQSLKNTFIVGDAYHAHTQT